MTTSKPSGDPFALEMRAAYDALMPPTKALTKGLVRELHLDEVLQKQVRPLVAWRIKSVDSFVAKARSKHRPGTQTVDRHNVREVIEDIGGIRILVYDRTDMRLAAERVQAVALDGSLHPKSSVHRMRGGDVTHADELGIDDRIRDVGTYEGVHIVVRRESGIRCEVQIRSVVHHALFEVDHRLRYKGDCTPESAQELRRLTTLAGVIDEMLSDLMQREGGPASNDALGPPIDADRGEGPKPRQAGSSAT